MLYHKGLALCAEALNKAGLIDRIAVEYDNSGAALNLAAFRDEAYFNGLKSKAGAGFAYFPVTGMHVSSDGLTAVCTAYYKDFSGTPENDVLRLRCATLMAGGLPLCTVRIEDSQKLYEGLCSIIKVRINIGDMI